MCDPGNGAVKERRPRDDIQEVFGGGTTDARLVLRHRKGIPEMARSYESALDQAITAMLREAAEHAVALRRTLEQVAQLAALREQVARADEDAGNHFGDNDKAVLTQVTQREREVLDQLVHGRSNRQIATSLGISERTVKNHLRNMFAKLGVTDRTSAVVKALAKQR